MTEQTFFPPMDADDEYFNPVEEPVNEFKMHFAGTLNSEETMWGTLPDGRKVYVEMLYPFLNAPEEERDEPEYWRNRIELGDFEDPDNYPVAWIEEVKKETSKHDHHWSDQNDPMANY